jgi:hypothetical protein
MQLVSFMYIAGARPCPIFYYLPWLLLHYYLLIERANAGCQGCCMMKRESLDAITSEPQLSEKLHKISRAIRNYEIPDYILKILHEGERKLEEFENELERLKQVRCCFQRYHMCNTARHAPSILAICVNRNV